jgi:hypothetical protein
MPSQNVLHWLDGWGWLVLSGDAQEGGEIRAQVLGRATADGGVAYVAADAAESAEVLNDMEDLGAPSGYVVDVLSEDDQTIQTRLADAGIVVISGQSDVDEVRSMLLGAAADGIQRAFERGAIILAEGTAASVFGAWVMLDGGRVVSGLEWLTSAFIVPTVTSLSESRSARSALEAQPTAIAIGIGAGSALALGPDGEVETWGRRQVTVALGRSYKS